IVTITPIDDAIPEPDETVVASLTPNTTYRIATRDATVTIADNEPRVTIAATDADASEGGPNPGVFTVTRTGSTAVAVTVNYVVTGTAARGADYTALSGSVTIPAGATTATITVTPIDDAFA